MARKGYHHQVHQLPIPCVLAAVPYRHSEIEDVGELEAAELATVVELNDHLGFVPVRYVHEAFVRPS